MWKCWSRRNRDSRLQRLTCRDALFQHYGEYGRNEHSVSRLCLYARAIRRIRVAQDQEKTHLPHAKGRNDSTVILFPAELSVTIQEYLKRRSKSLEVKASEEKALTFMHHVTCKGTHDQLLFFHNLTSKINGQLESRFGRLLHFPPSLLSGLLSALLEKNFDE